MVLYWIRCVDFYVTWTGYIWGLFSAGEGTMMTFYGIFMTGNVIYLLSRNLTTNDQMNGFRYVVCLFVWILHRKKLLAQS